MSNTERAPEPTMEDILASIRRIITDDDVNQGQAEQPAEASQAEEESLEGEADNQIIDDIARVLSGSGETQAADDEEMVMDLASELGGLELVEDEPEAALEPDPIEAAPAPIEAAATPAPIETAPEFVDVGVTEEVEEVLELEDVEPDILEPDVLEPDVLEPDVMEADIVEAAPAAEQSVASPPPLPPEPQPVAAEASVPGDLPPDLPLEATDEVQLEMAPQAEEPSAAEAPKLNASEEAATALERAIAALKAGQSPGGGAVPPAPEAGEALDLVQSPEAGVEEFAEAIPQPIPMAEPMDDPVAEEGTHPDPEVALAADAAGELESLPEDGALEGEPALEMVEEIVTETEIVFEETEEALFLEEAEPEAAPFWPPQPSEAPSVEAEPEVTPAAAMAVPAPEPSFSPEPLAAQINGAALEGDAGTKSLEDSIKEMLRPMLREWLDENMPRLIREELDSDASLRRQD